MYAKNLSNGFFATPEFPDFTSGPGYPLILMPFVAMDAPIWMMRALNPFFLIGACFFFYHTARGWVPRNHAIASTLLLALNPILLRYLPHAKTETLSVFLACGFIWAYVHLLKTSENRWKWVVRAGVFLFFLTMVRVIFGYVAMAAVVAIPLFLLFTKQAPYLRNSVTPFFLALILCIPWLSYTYSFTGKIPCWSTNGGELLYWITSPYQGEWGSWFSIDDLPSKPQAFENHIAACASVEALPFSKRDEQWKTLAKENIHEAPLATVRNLTANLSRMFFGFPFSHRPERLTSLFWIFPGGIILSLMMVAVYPTIRAWEHIPLAIKILALCALIFFGGSALLPAEPRYLLPIFPIALLWLTFVYAKIVRFRFEILALAPNARVEPTRFES